MIALVAGTRPNFMKIAPIWRALRARGEAARIIHTGQHKDPQMSDVFFRDLGLPESHVRLSAEGRTHAEQTASVLVAVEAELLRDRPSMVVVVGDVTSTLCAALAAAKLGIGVVHVEAGLRSRDWTMPEEINRVLTDRLSDLLLTPSEDAEANLRTEGIAPSRIRFVGNVMIDSLLHARTRPTDALARHGVEEGNYALVTLHRPSNVDTRQAFEATLAALEPIGARLPVLFPVHPRTIDRAASFGLLERLRSLPNVRVTEPLGYDDFVTLMARAKVVATDSGGIQEETTALSVPCLTLREGTERPITVDVGTNVIVGLDSGKIARELDAIMKGTGKRGGVPAGWDGHAGERVAEALCDFARGNPPRRVDVERG